MSKKRKYNGEGTVYETIVNGKKYYKAQISLGYDRNGKRIRKSFCGYKKSEVIKKLQQAIFKYGTSTYSYENISFGDFFKEWLYNYKKIELKANSFSRYESMYRLKIQNYRICRIKLKDLKTKDIQKHITELIETEEISVSNAKRLLTLIHSCLNWAIHQEYIYRNFAIGVKLPKEHKSKNTLNNKVFSKEEQKLFIQELNTKNTIDLLILTAFCTGLRLGEITALTWEDLKENTITIDKQYQNEYQINEDGTKTRQLNLISTKTTSSERIVVIPDNLIEILKEYKTKQEKHIKKVEPVYKNKNLIFANDIGDPIEHKRPNRQVKTICKKLNLPERTFHAIRHSYATRLFELQVPIKTIQELLGHSSINTTMNIYTHVMLDEKQDAIQKLNGII